jgi:hypothetical protein
MRVVCLAVRWADPKENRKAGQTAANLAVSKDPLRAEQTVHTRAGDSVFWKAARSATRWAALTVVLPAEHWDMSWAASTVDLKVSSKAGAKVRQKAVSRAERSVETWAVSWDARRADRMAAAKVARRGDRMAAAKVARRGDVMDACWVASLAVLLGAETAALSGSHLAANWDRQMAAWRAAWRAAARGVQTAGRKDI